MVVYSAILAEQTSFFDVFQKAISPARLDVYRSAGGGESEAISRYFWNVALSEALYPTLQTLEVALRNSIHHAACESYNSRSWFDGPNSPLLRFEREAVEAAKQVLTRHQKTPEDGRIIAELNFGFWTSLFNRRYEQVLWPRMLEPVFPHMPRRIRTRRNLSNRFNDVRKLRNRVFHHERIIHLQDLPRVHGEIIEAIGWISPVLKSCAGRIDRFPHVHGNGLVEVRDAIRSLESEMG